MQQGKAGKTSHTLEAGASVRDLFKHTEDFLTSTVFERISYLEDSIAWEILCKTFPQLPQIYNVARVKEVAFWPKLDDALSDMMNSESRKQRYYKEPDVVFKLELGDPAVEVLLIIEVKAQGGKQDSRQWENQLRAAMANEDYAGIKKFYYAALDGLDGRNPWTLWEEVDPDLRKGVIFAHASWRNFGKAVGEFAVSDRNSRRIISDINEALSIYGYRVIALNKTLLNIRNLSNPKKTLGTLCKRGHHE